MLRPHFTFFSLILMELFKKGCIVTASKYFSYLHENFFKFHKLKLSLSKANCDIDKNMRLKENLGL